MRQPIRREFRPPPVPPSDPVLGYANPKVEKEIARKWRRHRLRELSHKASFVGAIVLIVGVWLALRFVFGITICIFPLP